mmetsp:Transcript_42312/g.126843  ORF Transcript_42312/g.126843 Transcript_42312/m.126843 type:complete len:204 (+) Transcript_42312:2627-3238(+)
MSPFCVDWRATARLRRRTTSPPRSSRTTKVNSCRRKRCRARCSRSPASPATCWTCAPPPRRSIFRPPPRLSAPPSLAPLTLQDQDQDRRRREPTRAHAVPGTARTASDCGAAPHARLLRCNSPKEARTRARTCGSRFCQLVTLTWSVLRAARPPVVRRPAAMPAAVLAAEPAAIPAATPTSRAAQAGSAWRYDALCSTRQAAG